LTRYCGEDQPETGEQIRDTTFLITRWGYDVAQVDNLLRSIAAKLDAGRHVESLVRNATFRKRWNGYNVAAVDWFLSQSLLRPRLGPAAENGTDPWRDLDAVGGRFIHSGSGDRAKNSGRQSRRDLWEHHSEKCWKAWEEFDRQPGTYLRLEWVKIARCELRLVDMQTIASMTYRWSDILGATDIPEMGDRVSINKGSFALVRMHAKQSRELVDETGTPVLYISGRNFERSAQACISFPHGRRLRFPVRGTQRANAIMTAVDEAGNSVVRYRIIRFLMGGLGRHNIEVAVHPGWELTDELVLAITISAPWLSSYFSVQRGGG
jgi:DivIVA domain-containing protein